MYRYKQPSDARPPPALNSAGAAARAVGLAAPSEPGGPTVVACSPPHVFYTELLRVSECRYDSLITLHAPGLTTRHPGETAR